MKQSELRQLIRENIKQIYEVEYYRDKAALDTLLWMEREGYGTSFGAPNAFQSGNPDALDADQGYTRPWEELGKNGHLGMKLTIDLPPYRS